MNQIRSYSAQLKAEHTLWRFLGLAIALILVPFVQRETWEQLKEYLELAGTLTLDAAIVRMFEVRSEKPQKTDDICVAPPSNVHRLHEHQLKAVGKTIAIREPEKAEIMTSFLLSARPYYLSFTRSGA